jgi:preprotein translocase subunit YajC
MEPLIVLAVTFVLLWVLFILPQQRRVRAHHALVASLEPGDQVVLSAGIFGRVVELGPEEMTLEVAPGVVLRVARQAVLRRIEDATRPAEGDEPPPGQRPDTLHPAAEDDSGTPGAVTDVPEPGDRGPSGSGPAS